MPNGFKRDLAATKALRANGLLHDRRSFLTLPDAEGLAHLKLFGADGAAQRQRLWYKKCNHDRLTDMVFAPCAKCKRALRFNEFEMDHKQGGLSGRCDCLHNLQALCPECHRAKHNREPQFNRQEAPHGGFSGNRATSTDPR